MSTLAAGPQKLVPAQVGFLAIYNPSLGNTDDTLDDQIVYYSSPETRKRRRRPRRTSTDSPSKSSPEERNERLRRIGLAQGMVEFGRGFSDGKPVGTVETEKSRIILHELESGWWIIASIDLTRLPKSKGKLEDQNGVEYSSREVKPPALLLEDLLRAHSTFLLHHASSMSALFVRIRRSKFTNLLGRYWDSYLSTWNVMMHGNPLVNAYGGIKLAGSGELGVGVGEEDRGSGEREVLEGFVARIEGLVDLVVARFGDAEPDTDAETGKSSKESKLQTHASSKAPWLGTGVEPAPEDGAVFLGVGALSRKSLRDITHWMEDLYRWGSNAYGVRDNPTATRKSREKDTSKEVGSGKPSSPNISPGRLTNETLQLRPAQVGSVEASNDLTKSPTASPGSASPSQETYGSHGGQKSKEKGPSLQRGRSSQSSVRSVTTSGGRYVSYLKLGYGTHWTLGGSTIKSPVDPESKGDKEENYVATQSMNGAVKDPKAGDKTEEVYDDGSDSSRPPLDDSLGHYLVGLMGDIEDEEVWGGHASNIVADDFPEEDNNIRTLLRTVTVELERAGDARAEADISVDLGMADTEKSRSSKHGGSEHTGTSHASFEGQDRNKTKKLRIIVYVKKPFIFTFLFELRTNALALSSLYRSLHHQLGPLQRPLLVSTNRTLSRPLPSTTNTQVAKTPIYDLIWDSKLLTISSTIPNIPEPLGTLGPTAKSPPWSRIEALHTHMQLLNTFAATRIKPLELESTSKTSRGWWMVWTRIPDPEVVATSNHSSSSVPDAQTPQLGSEKASQTAILSTTSLTSTTNPSMYSGPAHPFLDRARANQEVLPTHNKEIFLLRQASGHLDGKSFGRFVNINPAASEGGWGSGTAKLAQGIGVDTKRYIEGLLNMNQ